MSVLITILRSLAGLIIIILIGLLLGGIIRLATYDASSRGFSGKQVFLLRIACIIFFPLGLILYLIFRPAARA